MPTVDTPRITATGTYPRITVNVVTGATGPGGGAVDSVNGQTGIVVLDAGDVGALPDDTVIPDISGLQATSEKNQPNGYAGLDGDGTIPDNRIPASIARDTEIGTQITAHDGSGTAHSTQFAGKVSTSAIDTDSSLAADSDTRVPSQKAVKAHVTTASGLLVPKSLVDAKGDLFVGTADNTVARLPVGPNTYVLTSDSAQASGVKWAAGTNFRVSGSPLSGSLVPTAQRFGGAQASLTHSGNMLFFTPMLLSNALTFDRVGVNVNTGSAGNFVRLGLYSSDGNGHPGTLVADWGTVTTDSTGTKELTISESLTPGLYWIGSVSSATITMSGWNSFWAMSMVSYSTATFTTGLLQALTFGALPGTATPSTETQRVPDCKLRVA